MKGKSRRMGIEDVARPASRNSKETNWMLFRIHKIAATNKSW